jgi:hypothetical protein
MEGDTMSRRHVRAGAPVALVALICGLVATATPAAAAIAWTPNALALAQSMMQDPTQVTSATLTRPTSTATSAAIADAPLSFFPTNGGTFGILSTGDARQADWPNANFPDTAPLDGSPSPGERSTVWSFSPTRGSAFDTTILRINLNLVATAQQNCLLLDFAFYSEEYAEFVGTVFNDAFLAQLDTDSWSVASGGAITAPGNFAFEPNTSPPRPVSVNASGPLSMSLANAAGTTYDGATPLLQAATPATPGPHSLYLSIFDSADARFDSSVFVDNIRWIRVQDPATQCTPGAVPYNEPPTAEANGPYEVDEGSSVSLDATGSSDPEGGALSYEWVLDAALEGSLDDPTLAAPTFTGDDDSTGKVELTVFDPEGQPGTDTATITVLNVAPTVNDVTAPSGTVPVGTSVDVSAAFTDPGTFDTHEYEIDWGDGSTPSTGPASGGTATDAHTYASPGNYTVTVTITDDDGGSDTGTATVAVASVGPDPAFLVIDEDSIDNGSMPNRFSASAVNDDIARLGQRRVLRYFENNVGRTITLHTGQVGDEGWFALKTIPKSWTSAGPTSDGLRNYLAAGPGLGTGSNPERWLDKIPDVTPLRATGLEMLEGRTVCAVVYDSDISMNYGPLNGSLKGDNLGIVAFEVNVGGVSRLTGYSSSSLPKVSLTIRDATATCGGPLALFTDAPAPRSSSEPFDVDPTKPAKY